MEGPHPRYEPHKVYTLYSSPQGDECPYYEGSKNFNLKLFWADEKKALPLHYRVYMAEVGPKKAAAANVETVFSGAPAGKFAEEADSTGDVLLRRI